MYFLPVSRCAFDWNLRFAVLSNLNMNHMNLYLAFYVHELAGRPCFQHNRAIATLHPNNNLHVAYTSNIQQALQHRGGLSGLTQHPDFQGSQKLELQEFLCHSRRYHPSSHGSAETNFVANGNYDCWRLWFVGRRLGFGGNYAAIHQLNHDCWNLFGMVKPPSGRADKFLVASQVLGAADPTASPARFQWLHRGAWIDQKTRAGCL